MNGAAGAAGRVPGAALCLLLFLAAAALNLAWLGRAPLIDTTEARHAEVGREFAADGHWLVPTVNRHPHLTKPPLTDWLVAAGIGLFGPDEFGARFLNALVAALGLVLTAWLAARLAGDRSSALVAAALYFACPLQLALARTISIDILLAALAAGGYLAVWEAARPDCRRPRLAALGFAAALGLGALAKGHVILLVLLAPALAWLVAGRRWPALRRLAWPPAVLLFLALALPWYLYINAQFPGWLTTMLGEELVERVASTQSGRDWPGAVILFLPGMALPAVPLAVAAVAGCRRRRPEADETARGASAGTAPAPAVPEGACSLLLLWMLLPLAVFGASRTQRANYLMPLVPAVAVLGALGWRRLAADWPAAGGARRLAAHLSAALTCLVGPSCAAAMAYWSWTGYSAEVPGLSIAAAAAAAAAGVLCLVLLAAGRIPAAQAAFLATAASLWAAALPAMDNYKARRSSRATFQWLARHADADQPVLAYRHWQFSYLFYLRGPMVTVLPDYRPAFDWAEPPPGAKPPEDLGSGPELAAASSRPGGAWLLVDRGRHLRELSSLARGLGLKFELRQATLHTFLVHLERGAPAPGPEVR